MARYDVSSDARSRGVVARLFLLVWTAIFLSSGLLEGAGVVQHSHDPARRTAHQLPAGGHDHPDHHRGSEHGTHTHPCPCSAVCELPDGRVRVAAVTSPEWDLPVVVRVADTPAPHEHLAAHEPYLIPYANGPPLRRA